jgi:hypothetical protein
MALPGGEYFNVSATTRDAYTEAEARQWRAFIMNLHGRENSFLLPAIDNGPQTPDLNPAVQSAVQGNAFATLNGIGAAGLKAGMFATFTLTNGKRQLVVLGADAAAGTQVVPFQPALRGNAAGAVEVRFPVVQVSLLTDNSGWNDSDGAFSIAFDAEEV